MVSLHRQEQRRITVVVLCVEIGLIGEQFRYILVALVRRQVQRRIAAPVRVIDVGLVGQQQFHQVFVVSLHGHQQRRIAVVVLRVDVGLIGQQQLRHAPVAAQRRQKQRRIAAPVFAGNQIRIAFEERLDFFQVALPRRFVNRAGEGWDCKSTRGQEQWDSSAPAGGEM